MKTFSLGIGAWEHGSAGEGASSPTPPRPHAPTPSLKGGPLRIHWIALLPALVLGLAATGCAYYSFTGATIPSQLNTVAIPLAVDNTISPVNTLDQNLTDLLTDRFIGQTRLRLETNEPEADAVLTTRIESYENEPTSVGGDEQATRNRVTIRVAVTYYDQVEDRELLEQTFSSFGEYDPADGSNGEVTAAEEALDNIADDVFSAATSDW